jgi:hypothetical protein
MTSGQHQDQRRSSIQARLRPLHLVVLRLADSITRTGLQKREPAAQKRSHAAIVLAVWQAGTHDIAAMVSPMSFRGRLGRAFNDHPRAVTVAAVAHARGYMHTASTYHARCGSGSHVSGIGIRMRGEQKAGTARRNVTNSPDGGLMSKLDTRRPVPVPDRGCLRSIRVRRTLRSAAKLHPSRASSAASHCSAASRSTGTRSQSPVSRSSLVARQAAM